MKGANTRNVDLLGNSRTHSWQDVKIARPSPEQSQGPYPGEAADSKGENEMERQTHKSESYSLKMEEAATKQRILVD